MNELTKQRWRSKLKWGDQEMPVRLMFVGALFGRDSFRVWYPGYHTRPWSRTCAGGSVHQRGRRCSLKSSRRLPKKKQLRKGCFKYLIPNFDESSWWAAFLQFSQNVSRYGRHESRTHLTPRWAMSHEPWAIKHAPSITHQARRC